MASNDADVVSSEASQSPIDLTSVYPARIFLDMWLTGTPADRIFGCDVVQRIRIYDNDGDPMWYDLRGLYPYELKQWGTEILSTHGTLREANEAVMYEAYELIIILRDNGLRPVVKHQVQNDGRLWLRVNFGPKSYFTMRKTSPFLDIGIHHIPTSFLHLSVLLDTAPLRGFQDAESIMSPFYYVGEAFHHRSSNGLDARWEFLGVSSFGFFSYFSLNFRGFVHSNIVSRLWTIDHAEEQIY
ncbi:hypothetical protein F4803DRAFT_573505 [Xylaria telfairii]|nr:hypothetical protein F4803DRAFT_573505 [Xylaria telfairii]